MDGETIGAETASQSTDAKASTQEMLPPPPMPKRAAEKASSSAQDMPPPQPKRPRLRTAKPADKAGIGKAYKPGSTLLGESFNWKAWCQCPRFSRPIQGTRFISLKTPLSTCYEVNMEVKDTFTVDMFVERFSLEKSKEPVCLVANAVWNSDKFYYNDHNVYDEWDIGLLNLPLQSDTEANSPGDIKEHLEPPSSKQVDKFVAAVREKWSEDPLQLIGVISLYGYNRSGVLIVSFLVEELKLPIGKALKRFADARPPGIYSKPCLEFLAKRYSSNIPLNIKVPAWDTFAIKTQPESKGARTSKPVDEKIQASSGTSKKEQALPKPWVKAFSKRMNREYFFNPVTKKSVWSIDQVQ